MCHMQILFPGGKSSPDMPLLLVHIQNLPHLTGKGWINLLQAISAVFMYGSYYLER